MFDLLKKKLTSFVGKLSSKVKEKPEEKKEEIKEEVKLREVEVKEKPKAPEIPKAPVPEVPEVKKEKKVEMEKEIKAKPSILTKIKGVFLPEVTIKETDVKTVISDLEIQLLEADVAVPVAEHLSSKIKENLVGKSVKYAELDNTIKSTISSSINDLLIQEPFDIIEFIKSKGREERPVKVLFIGPNGAGKTTAIAKIAYLLKKNDLKCVISASDTFRAAALEQTIEHAERVGVPVIKHQYGADPTAVAFDAVEYAKAHNIDVVLIDTAGRQETSRNLIEQLRKINRVIKPDLKLFVGEGIVGNAIIDQVQQFNEAVPLDGVILTKVDCDAKGGTVISIRKATGIPILYFGIGQGYEDLIKFDPNFILSRLLT